MVLINDLFSEAIAQCQELSQEAEGTRQALAELSHQAETLGQRMSAEADHGRQELERLATALATAEGELRRAGEEARRELDQVVAEAHELEAQVGQLLAGVEQGAQELDGRADQVLGDLEHAAEGLKSHLEALTGQLQHAEETAVERVQRSEQAIGEMLDAIRSMGTEVQEEIDRFRQEMATLETEVETQINAVGEALEDSIDHQLTALDGLADRLTQQHNQAVEALQKSCVEQALHEIESAAGPLRTAIEAIEGLEQSGATLADERCSQITAQLEELVRLMDRIEPCLGQVDLLQ